MYDSLEQSVIVRHMRRNQGARESGIGSPILPHTMQVPACARKNRLLVELRSERIDSRMAFA
jgi:hypothetical protein